VRVRVRVRVAVMVKDVVWSLVRRKLWLGLESELGLEDKSRIRSRVRVRKRKSVSTRVRVRVGIRISPYINAFQCTLRDFFYDGLTYNNQHKNELYQDKARQP
jgi:hypothetical protein